MLNPRFALFVPLFIACGLGKLGRNCSCAGDCEDGASALSKAHRDVIAALLEAVRDPKARELGLCLKTAEDFGIEAEATDSLLAEIPKYDCDIDRAFAFRAIASFGARASKAAPRLSEFVKNGPPERQVEAALTLGTFGIAEGDVIGVIRQRARDVDDNRAFPYALALCQLAPDDVDAAARLIRIAQTPDSRADPVAVVHALRRMPGLNRGVDEYLTGRLASENGRIASAAAEVLLANGVHVQEATAALVRISSSGTEPALVWRELAVHALAKYSLKPGIVNQFINEGLASTNCWDRRSAILALAETSGRDVDKLPRLLEFTRDSSYLVRTAAISAIGRTGARSDDVRAALVHATRDPSEFVRWRAMAALQKLGMR